MNRISRQFQPHQTKSKECLPRQIFTEDLDTVRHDSAGCNSAEECLLPKQGAVGSNPITRSNTATNHIYFAPSVPLAP